MNNTQCKSMLFDVDYRESVFSAIKWYFFQSSTGIYFFLIAIDRLDLVNVLSGTRRNFGGWWHCIFIWRSADCPYYWGAVCWHLESMPEKWMPNSVVPVQNTSPPSLRQSAGHHIKIHVQCCQPRTYLRQPNVLSLISYCCSMLLPIQI